MKDYNLCLVALALTLYACSSGSEAVDSIVSKSPSTSKDSRIALTVNAKMTRAINNQWSAGDSIGIVLFDVGTTDISDDQTNYHYSTVENATGNFTPISTDETAYYPSAGGNVDILAYYPYNPSVGKDLLIPLSTTDQTNVPMIDFMVTDKLEDRNADNPSVALTFRHKMARINIKLTKDEINADAVKLETAKITYMGGPMTAVWSMKEQNFIQKGPATDLVFPLNNATGTGSAIVIPTSEADSIQFKIEAEAWGGFTNTYYATLFGDVLEPGTDNNISIKISQDQVRPKATVSLEVTDWTIKEVIKGDGEAAYE